MKGGREGKREESRRRGRGGNRVKLLKNERKGSGGGEICGSGSSRIGGG